MSPVTGVFLINIISSNVEIVNKKYREFKEKCKLHKKWIGEGKNDLKYPNHGLHEYGGMRISSGKSGISIDITESII